MRTVTRSKGELQALLLLSALALVLLSGTTRVAALSDDLPKPSWGSTCATPYTFCSNVEVYRYWPEKKERLQLSVNAMMHDPNDAQPLRIWFVMDEPDIDLAKAIYREGMSSVIVNLRGTELSPSHYTCERVQNPFSSQCWLLPECVEELAANASVVGNIHNVSHFNVNQSANDLQRLLTTLGSDRKNIVLTQGLSSAVVLQMLQFFPDVSTSVVLMDFVNPALFDAYNYFRSGGLDAALQRVLAMCDEQILCVSQLGASDGSWNRLRAIVSLAQRGDLTCGARLKWSGGQNGEPFLNELRAVLAHMLRYPVFPFVTSDPNLVNLIPSLLYRVQRCNDKDVAALNSLYDYFAANKNVQCTGNLPMQMLWLVNDFLLSDEPTDIDAFRSDGWAKHLLLPSAASLAAFHAAAVNFPRVNGAREPKVVPENATQHILLLMADLDALLPYGAASMLANAFHGLDKTAIVRAVGGVMNQPGSVLTDCIIQNLKVFHDTGSWAGADRCTLQGAHKVDFVTGETKAYYGTADAWDFDYPNTDDTKGAGGGGGGGGGGETPHSGSKALRVLGTMLLVILLLGILGAGGYATYCYYTGRSLFRHHRLNDDFYENLHR